MSKEKAQKEKDEKLIEIAAEQFARLFWKHCLYNRELERSRSRNHNQNKSNKDSN